MFPQEHQEVWGGSCELDWKWLRWVFAIRRTLGE